MPTRLIAAGLVSAFCAVGGATPAWAGDPIMPLSELRAGMQCEGRSVIRGTEVSSFDVEILDVVSGEASASEGARILIRVSGPAVDATGVGPGFSGSPIYCRDGNGTQKNAGAISEAIGEYGGKVVLATPIEEILANPVDPPRAKRVGRGRASRAGAGASRAGGRGSGAGASRAGGRGSGAGASRARGRGSGAGASRAGGRGSGAGASRVGGARASRLGPVLPLAAPLTVSGLSRPLADGLTAAAAKLKRPILAAPAAPLTPFPVTPPRPGTAMTVGYSTGDLSIGAVGTVAYVDADRVWAFGHPFENSGLRSLLLQDAYVYRVINNPNASADSASTYKLAAVGHPLGTISNDATAAVAGRSGPLPPTVPVRIFVEDEDTGARSTLGTRVVDETDIDTPTGSSALAFVGPLAVAQAASSILRSAPAKLTGTMCVRIAIRESRRPLRFCNRYVSASAAPEPDSVANVVAAGAATDVLAALTEIDDYKASRLHVTELAARVKLARGQRQAFIRSVTLPRRVRPGSRVRARMSLQVVRGPRLNRRFRLRIPRGINPGTRRVTFAGTDVDDPDSELFGSLVETITIGGSDEQANAGDPGAASLAELFARVRFVGRYDGVRMRIGGRRRPAYRDPELRISGRVATEVRVVRRRR